MVTMNRPVRFRLIIIVTLAASNAAADVQAWSGLEARVPVSNGRYGAPTHARWVTETRFGGARDGLSLVLVRLSPMWELSPNVLLNLNGVQAMAADNAGVMRPESRVEIEPNIRGRVGPWAANFRQRAELRWISADIGYRYRAQVRMTYHPKDGVLATFTSTEIFVVTRSDRDAQCHRALAFRHQDDSMGCWVHAAPAANERGLGFEPCWDGDVHVRAGARSYRRVRRWLSRRWPSEAPA